MQTQDQITQAIMADPENRSFTDRGIAPLFAAPVTARINIVGQAPGLKAQNSRLYWNDQSGDRLRHWLGVDRDLFYHSGLFAVIPMDFYYPGKGKSGDLPPRKGFAAKWHPQILAQLPQLELTILIGQYAERDRHSKKLPRISTALFAFGTSLSTKSTLAGEKPLVCTGSHSNVTNLGEADY